jgi:hypothetical protein
MLALHGATRKNRSQRTKRRHNMDAKIRIPHKMLLAGAAALVITRRHLRSAVLVGALALALGWPGIAVSSSESFPVFAGPVPGEASLEGSVTSVSPSGESFTVGTTTFSFPDIPMYVLDRLRPGSFARVRFSEEGGEKLVTSIEVQGPGRTGLAAVWTRPPSSPSVWLGRWLSR